MKHLPKNLLCFSHLRWDFVYQRPQHLLTRFSKDMAVYFLEEPIFASTDIPYLTFSQRMPNLWVCVPHLPDRSNEDQINNQLRELIQVFFANKEPQEFTFWYYTPMALKFTDHLKPGLTVYDCMDELAAFKFAPAELKGLEETLYDRADVVFTGGASLFEAKKRFHSNTYLFPSSIDKLHFAKARCRSLEPADQARLSGPKIGFYGVIDERFDIELIRDIAQARPAWNIVLIGPVVKIDPALLPKNKNIHYLGARSYDELPHYLSGWDVAMIPFLLTESTRYISPTKTPEYLAGGKPVVSTPIRDVVYPYGERALVSIAQNAEAFVEAIEGWLKRNRDLWLVEVDAFLNTNSWDLTCTGMADAMVGILNRTPQISLNAHKPTVSQGIKVA